MAKKITVGIFIVLALIGAYFTWSYAIGAEERQYKNELEAHGVSMSSVWVGKLTSGHNFFYAYVDKLDATSIQGVLSYAATKPELADSSLRIQETLEGGSRYSGNAFRLSGVVGNADYTVDVQNFLGLQEGYRTSLESADYYTDGVFATLVVDENGDRFKSNHDMVFHFPGDTPKDEVTQFMQSVWAIEDAHRHTTVWYGRDHFSDSTIDGNKNNRMLEGRQLEEYKQDILQQIVNHQLKQSD